MRSIFALILGAILIAPLAGCETDEHHDYDRDHHEWRHDDYRDHDYDHDHDHDWDHHDEWRH